ncbi:hypothetical protein MMC28_001088 [Mycoblastus sanguinarius]|nr:hypothetical protein [Mycoblastus sanguinarius]
MSPIPSPGPKHVPAWKKLGLKLKFAEEEPENTSGRHTGIANGKKRKALDDTGASTRATTEHRHSKKPKKTESNGDKSTVSVNGNSTPAIEDTEQQSSPPKDPSTPSTKRKSVSFTPETKTQDGDSVKQLYRTWVASQVAKNPSFNPLTASPALKSVTPATFASPETSSSFIPTSAPSPTPKKTEVKKAKSKTKPKSSQYPSTSDPSQPSPAVSYLQTHHTDLEHWKFSKPHQNHLLKHLFSLSHLPSFCDSALLSYFKGLQGSARSRVRQEALAIREEDAKWLASDSSDDKERMENETNAQCLARRRRDYEAAVSHIKEVLQSKEDAREERDWSSLGDEEEWEERLSRRRRAEVVLWGVGDVESVVEDAFALPKEAVSGNSGSANGGWAGGAKAPTKIVFGDDGIAQIQQAAGMNGLKRGAVAISQEGKRKRKRRRTTAVPDDESSSSESSSDSSSEESEEEEKRVEGAQGVNGKMDARDQTSS